MGRGSRARNRSRADTSARSVADQNPDRQQVLLLLNEPWLGSPLRERDAVFTGDTLEPAELGLTAQLADDLATWHADADNAVLQAILDDSDPSRLGPIPEDYQPDPGHAVEGFQLAARLQRELGDKWAVWHTSSHDFPGPLVGKPTPVVRHLDLRALDGAAAVLVLDGTGRRSDIRPAETLGASPATIAALALWRRTTATSNNATTRAQGAEAAALLQHDLALTATIQYEPHPGH